MKTVKIQKVKKVLVKGKQKEKIVEKTIPERELNRYIAKGYSLVPVKKASEAKPKGESK